MTAQVLEALRAAGDRGLTLGELLEFADGCSIARAAALVEQMRVAGHRIEIRERRAATVYLLVDGASLFAPDAGRASLAGALDPLEKP